jgi:hypothetical protein
MNMDEARDAVTDQVRAAVRKAREQRRVELVLTGVPNFYADVRDGREPRGLPIHGEHALGRLGQELDRERARLVVVFSVSGRINGVDFDDVTIWLQGGQATLPTLLNATDNARRVLYAMARDAVDRIARECGDDVLTAAWVGHLAGLAVRIKERQNYLDALQTKINTELTELGRTLTVTSDEVKRWA